MPTYEYVCLACGHEFELFQQMSDSVRRKCPECTKLRLKRLIGTGSGVIFKGGGFYETDYRSDSYKKDAKAEKKAKEDTSTSKKDESSTKSGGKPEKNTSGDGASKKKSKKASES